MSSFECFREKILSKISFVTLTHLGLGVFDAMVRTVMFVIRDFTSDYIGAFIRLVDNKNKEETLLNKHKNDIFYLNNKRFSKLPGKPIAFWVSDSFFKTFDIGKPMNQYVNPKQGLLTNY